MLTKEKKNRKEEKSPSPIKKEVHEEFSVLKTGEPQIRYLKIQPFCRKLRYGRNIVPELRLNGRWLEEAGFHAEEHVSVTVRKGLLIIRTLKE